jgi:hypothetical protein
VARPPAPVSAAQAPRTSGEAALNNLRLAAACSLWLVPAAARTLSQRRIPPAAYPAALAVAAAVTAAVLADELQARRGDQVTGSVLAALEIDRRDLAAADQRKAKPGLRLAGRPLAGCAAL